jgi:predicted nuclease with TOPRIM domain
MARYRRLSDNSSNTLIAHHRRIVHLTFYKCASQWVRDILTDPELSHVTGFPLSMEGIDVSSAAWPEQPGNTFAGPFYSASYDEWLHNSRPEDRAIVVLRDPRDIVISLVFSLGFSHVPSVITRLLREPISAAGTRDRIRIGMFLLTQWSDRMRSWASIPAGGREYRTIYRRLVEEPKKEFAIICRFLNWDAPQPLLERIIERHSFENKTGRRRGEVNPYSHRRKGIAGDWRNYFDRELGAEFESTFPALVRQLGFEMNDRWFESLPERVETDPAEAIISQQPAHVLMERLAALEEQSNQLVYWRTTAEQRLLDNEELSQLVNGLQAQVAEPHPEAERRLADVIALTQRIADVEKELLETRKTAGERLSDVHKLTALVKQLESRLAAPDGDAESRMAQIYTLTSEVHELQRRLAEPNTEALALLKQVNSLTAGIHEFERRLVEANTEAESHIAQIIELTARVGALQDRIAQPNPETTNHIEQIRILTARIHELERRIAGENLASDNNAAHTRTAQLSS